MADTNDKTEWESIILQNTSLYENHRYDWLQTVAGQFGLADIKADMHRVSTDSYSYRSYGTYRRSVLCDTSFIKENETYLSEEYIINNFYDINQTDYTYGGIVLSYQFATNANEASLEDLFCEFGYDFIKAIDTSIFVNTNKPKYFDNDTEVNGAWSILPIGAPYTYQTKDEITGELKYVTETVEYDGTYIPTVQELLDGSLYIIIKSGSLDPQKIYFNNTYLPSLFINDDKFPNTLNVDPNSKVIKEKYSKIHVSSNDDTYIINEQQPFKLCDIQKFERIACIVSWDNIFSIENIKELTDKMKEKGFNDNEYDLLTAAWAEYTFVRKEVNGTETTENDKLIYYKHNDSVLFCNYSNAIKNPTDYVFNNIKTPSLHIGTATSGTIKIDVYFTVLLMLKGYSTTPQEVNPGTDVDAYEFDWWENSDDFEEPETGDTYEPQLLVKNSGDSSTPSNVGSISINVLEIQANPDTHAEFINQNSWGFKTKIQVLAVADGSVSWNSTVQLCFDAYNSSNILISNAPSSAAILFAPSLPILSGYKSELSSVANITLKDSYKGTDVAYLKLNISKSTLNGFSATDHRINASSFRYSLS